MTAWPNFWLQNRHLVALLSSVDMISLNYTENYFHFSRIVRQQLIITYLEHKEERERMMMLWNNYSDFHYRTC